MPRDNGGLIGKTKDSGTSGVWDLADQVVYQREDRWDRDPYFSNVILLHMDGSNGSTVFTDSSSSPISLSGSGNAGISTSQSKFGTASCYFDGSGDFLSSNYNSKFDLLVGDFTVECWIYPVAYKSSMRIASTGGGAVAYNSTNGIHWLMQLNSNQLNLQIRNSTGGGNLQTTTATPLNTWTHIAVCVSGNTGYVGVGGTVISGNLGTVQRPSTNPSINIGSIPGENASATIGLQGYIDEFRITKGVARYVSNYEVPYKRFPNV